MNPFKWLMSKEYRLQLYEIETAKFVKRLSISMTLVKNLSETRDQIDPSRFNQIAYEIGQIDHEIISAWAELQEYREISPLRWAAKSSFEREMETLSRIKGLYDKISKLLKPDNKTHHSNGRLLEDDLTNLERLLEYSEQQTVEISTERKGYLETDLTNLVHLIEHANRRKKRKVARREGTKDNELPSVIIKPKVRTNGVRYPFRFSFFLQLPWKNVPRHHWEAMTVDRIKPSWRPHGRYFGYGKKV